MRHHIRLAATALLSITLIAADSLEAQRRTSGGSGGTSSGGSSSGGSTSRGSGGSGGSGGGSRDRGGSGGGTTSRPSSAPAARGSGGRSEPAAAAQPRDRGTSTSDRPDASATGGSSGRTGTATARGREGRAGSGKIGAVRRSADDSRRRGGKVFVGGPVYVGGCYSCDYWGWYGGRWGWYGGGWWYPEPYYPGSGGHVGRGYDDDERDDEEGGDGYLDYPYEANNDGETFARTRTRGSRGFGTLSAQYFSDVASDVSAGRIGFEGVSGKVRLDLDYAHYAEPVTGGTDRMQTFRAGVGFQPRLGDRAYAVIGIGGRGVWLNQGGGSAGGPEGTLGLQVLPFKPFGVNVTGRLAAMRWSRSADNFAMAEMNTTGSVFLGRAEIQAGWHWLKLEGAPAFGGPIVGVRMWF